MRTYRFFVRVCPAKKIQAKNTSSKKELAE